MSKVLPDSTLPEELRQLGHDVREIGEGERVLAIAIMQKLTLTRSGVFEEQHQAGGPDQDPCRDRARAALQAHHDVTAF